MAFFAFVAALVLFINGEDGWGWFALGVGAFLLLVERNTD